MVKINTSVLSTRREHTLCAYSYMLSTTQVINLFYQKFTSLPLETVEEETDRENYMTPHEAQKLGLIDAVLE